ncbi:MAG: c-type cytochrome [Methylophilaceae bacterium]
MSKLLQYLLLGYALLATKVVWAEDGKALFEQRCSACHGAAGVGTEGIAPPLQNPELWQLLGPKGETYIACVMTGGMSGTLHIGDNDYRGLVMPSQAQVDSNELASIAAYVVKTLNSGTVSPSAKLIDEFKASPMSHQALRALRKGN